MKDEPARVVDALRVAVPHPYNKDIGAAPDIGVDLMDHAPRCAPPKEPTQACYDHVVGCLGAAHARAVVRRAPVFVRLHVALPSCDPWEVQAAQAADDAARFLWHDGATKLCAAAWGDAAWHPLAGAAPFAQAQAHCTHLLEEVFEVAGSGLDPAAPSGHDADAPLAFAAFAFDADAADAFAAIPPGDAAADPEATRENPSKSPWGHLAGGAMLVPSHLVYRRHGASVPHAHGVLAAHLGPNDDAAAVAQALCGAWATLYAAAQTASAEACDPPPGAAGGHEAWACGQVAAGRADQEQWVAGVRRAQADMQAGRLTKIVLARQSVADAPPDYVYDAAATLRALRAQHPRAVTYAVTRGDGTTFLGATPEVLVRVQGRALDTQAVAGTAPRGASPAEDAAFGQQLLHSHKDQTEHAVVADSLAADLAPLCLEVTRPPRPRLIALPRLHHLETPFRATLRQMGGVLPLCARLHPTPATGGFPRARVKRWLAAHESLDRGLFAGPIGWLTAGGDGTFAVALRSMLLTPKRVVAFAGAGIVPASEAMAEWRETELKLTTAQDALRLKACKPPQTQRRHGR